MSNLKELIKQNHDWARRLESENPGFFERLANQQQPEYLWIGCADSRVPATQIADMLPGEIFVHRNIANVVVHTDLNCLSVIQFAVEVLRVKHIIVCGHYDCGGVKASLQAPSLGLIENWLHHIRDIYQMHSADFRDLQTEQEKVDLLCRLNVREQVLHTCQTTIVQQAWQRGQSLAVHGLIYRIQDGLLEDLDLHVSNLESLQQLLPNP
ncbi:MAG: carbonate dehydratase [Leptospiraceae bacterium]|nr:carbonate dehydratase [Leptospiraceae bacterium]